MKKEGYLQKSRAYKGYHYSILAPEMLDYLHRRTLEMMKIILPIFEDNNIRYMICGGTLLGAATTHKFIPWDDDFDICIYEEDYEKAEDLLIKAFQDGTQDIAVQSFKTEKNYYLDWIKIRDKKSHVYPDIPNYQENGVWIDLYKLRKIPSHLLKYTIAKGHLDYIKRRYSKGGLTKKEYYQRLRERHLKFNVLFEKMKSLFRFCKGYTYVIWSASKVSVNEEWVFPNQYYEFEGVYLKSFNKAEAYLSQHYGDNYMVLPNDELRRVGLTKIDYSYNEI